jgi:Arc/MetJ family transcription regulator
MRTNIVIDDDLLAAAMRLTAARSKRSVVAEALRTFVAVKRRETQTQDYRERLRSLASRLNQIHLSESPLEVLRKDRERL